jgi:anti-sigma B factor antagonist
MDINVRTVSGTTVVDLSGELTWKSAPEAEQRILAEVQPQAKICLDMSRVTYMASAGLRLLLKVYRTVSSQGGRVSEDIRDTIEVTGFLTFFTLCDNLESGIADLTS